MEEELFIRNVLALLKRRYRGEMRTSLRHRGAWQMLVATILSAQSQDAQVNKVTPSLFRRYGSVGDYASLEPEELYAYIKSIGLYKSKARSIVGAARGIREHFGSRVPRTIKELVSLPGVGRKTANVVLSDAFGINEGIAIDTHCITVSGRLGIARTRNPEAIERKLMSITKRKEWGNISHLFIALGRDTCRAHKKRCRSCILKNICPSSDI